MNPCKTAVDIKEKKKPNLNNPINSNIIEDRKVRQSVISTLSCTLSDSLARDETVDPTIIDKTQAGPALKCLDVPKIQ